FHAEHHFFPTVPHYYLPELHKILQKDPYYRERYLLRPDYVSFLKEYWKEISAPAPAHQG
ncbi:MAG TPA: fatty acid desaturase, partial [Candidatus Obscuribacterales bacterium]